MEVVSSAGMRLYESRVYSESGCWFIVAATACQPGRNDSRSQYAVIAATAGVPIIVSLIQADLRSGDALREQIASLADVVAKTVDHPLENVHIVIEPPARGRIAFGGRLVE